MAELISRDAHWAVKSHESSAQRVLNADLLIE
jgi:hypothetical protein